MGLWGIFGNSGTWSSLFCNTKKLSACGGVHSSWKGGRVDVCWPPPCASSVEALPWGCTLCAGVRIPVPGPGCWAHRLLSGTSTGRELCAVSTVVARVPGLLGCRFSCGCWARPALGFWQCTHFFWGSRWAMCPSLCFPTGAILVCPAKCAWVSRRLSFGKNHTWPPFYFLLLFYFSLGPFFFFIIAILHPNSWSHRHPPSFHTFGESFLEHKEQCFQSLSCSWQTLVSELFTAGVSLFLKRAEAKIKVPLLKNFPLTVTFQHGFYSDKLKAEMC